MPHLNLAGYKQYCRKNSFYIAAIALVLSAWLLFFFSTPPLQVPDEDGHYAYVHSLANNRYPVLTNGEAPHESVSDIGRRLREAFLMEENRFDPQRIFNTSPKTTDNSASDYVETSVQAYHPPAYYLVASLFYRVARFTGFSPITIFFLTKLSSLFFYLLFLTYLWKYLKTIWPQREADYLTLAIALQPTMLMVAVGINPEIGAIAMFTVAWVMLLRKISTGAIGTRAAMILGILTALAVLTKFTNVILVPVVLLVVIFCGKEQSRTKLRFLSVFLTSMTALLAPWLAFNLWHYHSLLPHNLALFPGSADAANTPSYLVLMTIYDLKQSLYSLLGVFGWLDAPIFGELRLIYFFICILFITAGSWYLLKRNNIGTNLRDVGFVSSVSMLILLLFLGAYSVFMKVKYQFSPGLTGRYYLIGLLPAVILFYAGLKSMLNIKNGEALARTLFFFSVLFMLIGLLYTLLPRFYV